jgi:hypothetical protein
LSRQKWSSRRLRRQREDKIQLSLPA